MSSLDQLKALRESMSPVAPAPDASNPVKITVAMGTCGIAAGARNALMTIMSALTDDESENVTVTQTGCMGMCEKEPLVEVTGKGEPCLYAYVTPERARRIIASHVKNGEPIVEWMVSRS